MKKEKSTARGFLIQEKEDKKEKSNKPLRQRSILPNWQQKVFKAFISLNWSTNYFHESVGANLERLV
jgi:hypothetical protein